MSSAHLFEAVPSPYLVPPEGLVVADAPTAPPEGGLRGKAAKKGLKGCIAELRDLQRRLYAENRWSVLLLFQAMDAAGKDGTIRAVMSGINPAGCQVHSFKQPSAEELDHDFLWRTAQRLPERGRMGIFNRSYYEEVLVVRVHPEYLGGQRLPRTVDLEALWQERFRSIRDHEAHLARSGTVVLKFWLNVSHAEQRRRFLDRIDDPTKNWKFSMGDVAERTHWPTYMAAYEELLRETSRPWAPWYAIPADDKPFMRLKVAEVLVETLRRLDPRYPALSERERARLGEARALLEAE